jgi:superfamily II DNA/RNA helicase
MNELSSWTSPEGHELLNSIVTKRIPAWKDGLREFQAQSIAKILAGKHLLCCTATGDGKSALFAVPILAHMEINSNPSEYPKVPTRTRPFGLVVTPTNGLAGNIVRLTSAAHLF